jgi:putative SOS response-associated peptidase YedK
MCYDISFTAKLAALSASFPELVMEEQITIDPERSIHLIGHSYGEHPIIYRDREGLSLHCRLMEWGCIPFYVKDEAAFMKQRAYMLNARSERILDDKSSYWHKIRNRRCLVPVTGFYEHRKVPGFKNKIPYYIGLKEQPLFFLPGLYSVVELPDRETGEMLRRFTFTVITRAANGLLQQIHNNGDNKGRMPLLLPPDLAKKWVEAELPPAAYQEILDFEMPSAQINPTAVFSIRTSKLRPDGKRANEPYPWQGLEKFPLVCIDQKD